MTARLVAIYGAPPDPAAFLHHYHATHLPLVRALPGLVAVTVDRVAAVLAGGAPPFLVTTMAFADRAALDAALASPAGRATARDAAGFPPGILTLVVMDGAGPDA